MGGVSVSVGYNDWGIIASGEPLTPLTLVCTGAKSASNIYAHVEWHIAHTTLKSNPFFKQSAFYTHSCLYSGHS